MSDLREDLIHLGAEALDGMRATARWDERSHLHLTDRSLAKIVVDAIWERLQLRIDEEYNVGFRSGGSLQEGYD